MAMCFRCKVNLQDDGEGVAAHPGGLTCEEFQQNVSCSNARLGLTVNVSDRRPPRSAEQVDRDVQFCPHCGVATVKSEGCNDILCVCGRHWDWEGDGGDDY